MICCHWQSKALKNYWDFPNVNYLVKDNQNEIKSVISSHGIEQLIKQFTRFDLTHKTSTLGSGQF